MKRLLALLVLLLAAGAVADLLVRSWAERRIVDAVRTELDVDGRVDADLSYPFLLRVLTSRPVPEVRVDIDMLREGGVVFRDVVFDADGLLVDEARVREGSITITGITSADLVALLTEADLIALTGLSLNITPAGIAVGVGPDQLLVSAQIVERRLVLLPAGGPPVEVALPPERILPCLPVIELLDGAVRLACTTTQLPAAIVDALAAR